jgi:mono/diheme cytochrome c family protein/glucose/arabinose dehydrogenase
MALLAAAPLAFVIRRAEQAQRPESAAVLQPDAAMKTFSLPEGFRVELVASEPLVSDPVFLDWDADGRLWVVEMPAYMTDIRGTNELTPNGRVVVLNDRNGDGQLDTRTVFADGLVLPRALKVLHTGVLVGEPPNLWLMRDTNGDDVADTRTLVTDTYGRRDANVEHNANGLMWALDNWIYTSEVDMFLRLTKGTFEVRKTLSRGQWGVSQDDAGRVYRNTNSSVLHVDEVPTPYYTRTAGLVRTRGSYESLATPGNDLNGTYPARPTPGVNRGYQFGVLRPDGRLASFTGVAAPTVYRGDRLPRDVYGNVFVAEPAGNLISRIIVTSDEHGVTASRAYADREFLTSTDERFRPVYLSAAPDGALYVVDMYRGIIQHKGYITEYLRDQILSRGLEQPIGLGRIYRIVHESTPRGPRPALANASGAVLVQTLSHPNGWWRDTAQRLIVERGDSSVVPALERLTDFQRTSDWRTRLHALWALDGLGHLTEEVVLRALNEPVADVRRSAVRLAERWVAGGRDPIVSALLTRMDDPSRSVRRQVAASLGQLPAASRSTRLAAMLERYADDPVVLDAAISGVGDQHLQVIAELSSREQATANRGTALSAVAAAITRAADERMVQSLFAAIANPEMPAWQRGALVAGTEIALLNAPWPGAIARRGGGPAPDAPCNTCPGGRGGPGGAPAFPAAPAGNDTAATTRNDGPRLRLAARPPLAETAALPADLAARVSAVMARVEWPGKPGVAIAQALTPAQQESFDAGKEVYEGLCQACHQPDGRGLEKVAPTLVGSALVNGSVEALTRVLLHGKEGSVGLMPPLGATLTDDQIAGSLTYVRRAWGHTASPVDAATVKKIRDANAGRTRPWTNDELAALK